tara:strand:- start:78 stop:1172 length:1095 start_codon:yes stop_codon:yes gene_type:complete
MGDITSGGVQDDAAANTDLGGGGSSSDSSNYNYSDLGVAPGPGAPVSKNYADLGTSPGFPGPATPVPTVSPPMSPFQLGFGGAQKVPNYMDDLNTLMGGGGSSADASAVSVSDQPSSFSYSDLGPSPADKLPGKPSPVVGPGEPSDEMVGLPLVTQPLAKPSFVDQQPQVTAAQADDAQKQFDALTSLKNPKTDQDFSFLGFVGNIFKGLGSGAKSLGDFISNLSASDAFKLFNDFLIGDPNFKGTPSSEIDPFAATPGPGPEVGGGVPSPSGTGSDMPITTMPETPAETVIKADPCPPGFKLDPILNQCMPIVKSAPTPPPMPTLPQPTAPTGGGIANVYPFTLTPPVGAPVGTVAPIRFTPK